MMMMMMMMMMMTMVVKVKMFLSLILILMCALVPLPLPPRSDLQICTTGTAAGNLGIIRKQLESVSCPTWDELADLKQRHDCQFKGP